VPPGTCWDSILQLGHDRFLQRHFQFIIHSSPLHFTYIIWVTKTASLNKVQTRNTHDMKYCEHVSANSWLQLIYTMERWATIIVSSHLRVSVFETEQGDRSFTQLWIQAVGKLYFYLTFYTHPNLQFRPCRVNRGTQTDASYKLTLRHIWRNKITEWEIIFTKIIKYISIEFLTIYSPRTGRYVCWAPAKSLRNSMLLREYEVGSMEYRATTGVGNLRP
jgi:hypothetical protein